MTTTQERFKDCEPAGANTKELKDVFFGKNVLFYIERSNNSNAVIYEANVNAAGELDEKEPVKVYWHLYARDPPSKEEGLTMLERNTAYGSTTKKAEAAGHYTMTLSALKAKKIDVYKDDKGFHATTSINGAEIELLHIYVENTTSWGMPKVLHVDIKGRKADGALDTERKMPE